MDKIGVKIKLTHPEACVPTYSKDGDAGADVKVVPNVEKYNDEYLKIFNFLDINGEEAAYQYGDYILNPSQVVVVNLGFRIELSPGWEMQVRSRSGLSKRGIVVANSPGTIDSGYRGPCMVLLRNNSKTTRILKPGTRVAQFVLKRAPQASFEVVSELSSSERASGGFGSTGVK